MSVERYSNDVIVVAVAEGPSNFKVWLREDAPADLASDLRWLCEEYMDSPVVLDLAHLGSLEAASYRLMLSLQELVEESDFRFVLCGCPRISNGNCSACVFLTNSIRLTPVRQPSWNLRPRMLTDPAGFRVAVLLAFRQNSRSDHRAATRPLQKLPQDWKYYTLTYPAARYKHLSLDGIIQEMVSCKKGYEPCRRPVGCFAMRISPQDRGMGRPMRPSSIAHWANRVVGPEMDLRTPYARYSSGAALLRTRKPRPHSASPAP